MSRSKRAAQAVTPAPKNGIKRWFAGDGGAVRGGWLLAASLAAWLAASLLIRRGLSAGFAALFGAWRIDAVSAARAPGWARTLYAWHGSLITLLVSGALLALAAALRRLWRLPAGKTPFEMGAAAKAWLLGTGMVVLIAALCLLPDSMRMEWPLSRPRIGIGTAVLWIISLAGALAEEDFSKRVLYDGLRARWGAGWAALCACAAFFLTNGGFSGSALSAVNVMLLGLAGCAIYARLGFWAAAAFRWGWSAANVFLLGFGGGEYAVYRLYAVSENGLTGGDAGFIYGGWTTLLLAAVIAWLERDRIRAVAGRLKRK